MTNDSLGIIYPKSSAKQIPYTINIGISPEHIGQLIEYSNTDPFFKNNTSDLIRPDGKPGRFCNITEYEKWYQNGKSIYTLVSPEGSLMGIVWLSKEIPKFDIYDLTEQFDHDLCGFTFAIRLYGEARGVGLALQFADLTYRHFCETDIYLGESRKNIWLETGQDNLPAIFTYKKLGYKLVGHNPSTMSVLMILEK